MNAQAKMERIIATFGESGQKPTLLLQCCCAPCASAVLERLIPHFRVTALYCNPNITDAEEYARRFAELERLCVPQSVPVIDYGYDPKLFFGAVSGLENEPEGGMRCAVCFGIRLGLTASLAKEGQFDYFATTLTLSPLKNADVLNAEGEAQGGRYGVKYLPSDFKKKDGYRRSVEISRELGLYRQNYCGCPFSMRKEEE